ncbi:hypothetical protein Tco_1493273 [Tanacetum coccineum]
MGSKPNVYSGEGGVCIGGAGDADTLSGLSDSGADPKPYPTSNVLYTSSSSNANSWGLNAPYLSPKGALTAILTTGAAYC